MKKYPINIPSTIHHEATTIEVIGMDGNPLTHTIEAYDESIYIPNTMSKEDYVRKVYQGMIENDASDLFIKYDKEQRAEAERIVEETIRANVAASITSSII